MLFQWISRQFTLRNKTTVFLEVIFGAVVFSLLLFSGTPAHAQNLTNADLGLNNQVQTNIGLPATDIRLVVANIIRVAFGLLGVVFLVLVLYAGYLWMTAGGNEEQLASAKKMLTNGVIGLAVMLSAYAIVSFVISRLLSAGNGGGSSGPSVGAAMTQGNVFGSGGLGTVIKDHYPARNQTGVPRNTKIIITFSQPIVAASIIDDTNGDGIFGNCKNQGKDMHWDTDCDHLKSGDNLIVITRADTEEKVTGAAALTSGPNGQVDTIVIRPSNSLGDDTLEVPYTVRIGNGVLFDDASNGNPSIFAGRSAQNDFYTWDFTCSTINDTKPPHITDVFPRNNTTEDKNSVIQINFNKPMDPTGLQGNFTEQVGFFAVPGNTIFLKMKNSLPPAGTFRLINNYQTLEFTPSLACGTNACGGTVYCLPVCTPGDASCETNTYTLLVRAGVAFDPSKFEAIPFSGAMDLSGNALDGNNDGTVDTAPQTGDYFADQAVPDNYNWSFTLADKLDVSAPYIEQVTPGPEATFIQPNNELSLLMSKRMRANSLYSIDIAEQPAGADTLAHRPLVSYRSDDSTYARIEHGLFQNKIRHYYYPVVDSRVEDVHFNCFYPGKGPTTLNPNSQTKASLLCNEDGTNCCDVVAGTSAFCCNGLASNTNRQTCLNSLQTGN